MFKKILKISLRFLISILSIVLAYLFLGYFIPFIEVSAKETTEPKVVELYILTNGVHTDLVVPVKTKQIDWSEEVPFHNTLSKNSNFRYVAFGWGDKGFYLDTPTWADLKFSTAFNAAFWLSESAIHSTFYNTMTEGEDCKKIMITESQYQDLVDFIQIKFDRDTNGNTILIETDAVYGSDDAFYDTKGKYSFLYTCNTWANDGLKVAGQKAALWTPSDFGIFQHYD
ncbi:MAG: TIGR02117 family protein [Moheibacter sp.]